MLVKILGSQSSWKMIKKLRYLLSFLQFFWFQRAISMLLSRALVMGPIFSALVQPTLKPHKGLYHLLGPAHPKNLDFVWFSQHFCKYAEILSKNMKKNWFPKSYIKNTTFILMTKNQKTSRTWCKLEFFCSQNWSFLGGF